MKMAGRLRKRLVYCQSRYRRCLKIIQKYAVTATSKPNADSRILGCGLGGLIKKRLKIAYRLRELGSLAVKIRRVNFTLIRDST